MLLSVSETGWLQSITEFLSQARKIFSEDFSRFSASASALIYIEHDEEADTRTVDHVHHRVSGAPFDGSSFYGLGTPFDGTPFDRLGTPFEGATL
ncbi:unnamed protein product [Camellia sinensis]